MKIMNSTSIEMTGSVTALDLATWLDGVPAGVRVETLCQTTAGDRPWESTISVVVLQAKWIRDTVTGKSELLK